MLAFRNLLSRADDEILKILLGGEFIETIRILDPERYSPSGLKSIVNDLYTPSEILSEKAKRKAIIDLLKGNEASELLKLLGQGDEPYPHSILKSTSFNKGTQKFQKLLSFFMVDECDSQVESSTKEISFVPNYPLFLHQRNAIKEVRSYLNSSNNRCILHMPTGSGKTRTAMNIVCNLLRNSDDSVVLWLANSEELCSQAYEEFGKAWNNLGDRELNVYKFWGNNTLPDGEQLRNGIIIAGFAKLYASIKESISNISQVNRFLGLIIVDEAHITIADTYKLVIDSMSLGKQKPPSILGLTATPGRTWNDPEADKELSDFYHKQKVTLNIEGFSNPIEYLVSQGYLAKAVYKKLEVADELSDVDIAKLQGAFEIPDSILKKLANDELRNLRIIDELERLVRIHKKIMFFSTTVQHSNLIASLMSFRGVWAKSVTSKTDPSLRQEYIREYKENNDLTMILCNFGVLTTGFDAPKTSCALIARPTTSLVLYSQMVGRAIRGTKAGGNKEAEIVTVVDNSLPGFKSVADSFINWEDIWE